MMKLSKAPFSVTVIPYEFDSGRSARGSKIRERVNASPRSWSDSPSSSPKAGPSNALEDTVSGYNSGDEHGPASGQLSDAEWLEVLLRMLITPDSIFMSLQRVLILQRDRMFEKRMRSRGFIVKCMKEDGACLFRAVSDQVFGDQEMHDIVRKQCMDYIVSRLRSIDAVLLSI